MHNKQNNKESKTYVQGLRSFGNTLPRGVKNILKKNGYNYSEIVSKWNMLVGKDISDVSHPVSIKMTKGSSDGVLLLLIKRGDEINIEYSKQEIINKINAYFGYKLISKIRLQTYTTKKNKPNSLNKLKNIPKTFEKKISEIKSEYIRNSLHQLLKAAKND